MFDAIRKISICTYNVPDSHTHAAAHTFTEHGDIFIKLASNERCKLTHTPMQIYSLRSPHLVLFLLWLLLSPVKRSKYTHICERDMQTLKMAIKWNEMWCTFHLPAYQLFEISAAAYFFLSFCRSTMSLHSIVRSFTRNTDLCARCLWCGGCMNSERTHTHRALSPIYGYSRFSDPKC